MRKQIYHLFLILGVVVFFLSLWTGRLIEAGELQRLNENTISSAEFREHNIDEQMLEFIQTKSSPGKYIGLYLLETKFGYQTFENPFTSETFLNAEKKWKQNSEWEQYLEITKSIWNDVKYFPIPEFTSKPEYTVSYSNTWMSERTFGGQRGHEGTDLMPSKSERGLFPIISMTDGTVEKKGWLEKGGYRIGIKTDNEVYFYYAHLDSYSNLNVGDRVDAGDILGYMGDSGYGAEGTTGQFAVHLHLGIYIYPQGTETSVNPYWILRYIENSKVKCYTEE